MTTKTSTTSPKKPADRKAPAPKTRTVAGQKVRDITVRGAKITVLEDALDDFELLDDLDQVQSGNPGKLPSVLRRLVGEDQWGKVLDLARDEKTGRVGIAEGTTLVKEIFEATAPNS